MCQGLERRQVWKLGTAVVVASRRTGCPAVMPRMADSLQVVGCSPIHSCGTALPLHAKTSLQVYKAHATSAELAWIALLFFKSLLWKVAHENRSFMIIYRFKMVIFHSHVKLPGDTFHKIALTISEWLVLGLYPIWFHYNPAFFVGISPFLAINSQCRG